MVVGLTSDLYVPTKYSKIVAKYVPYATGQPYLFPHALVDVHEYCGCDSYEGEFEGAFDEIAILSFRSRQLLLRLIP